MSFSLRPLPKTVRLFALIICFVSLAAAATSSVAKKPASHDLWFDPNRSALVETSAPAGAASYKWNLEDNQLPLLDLPQRLGNGLDRSLSYRMDQLRFPIFQALNYDEERGTYLLPSISSDSKSLHFVEFRRGTSPNSYTSIDGTNIQLIDNDNLKTFRTSDGTRYIFVRYPDGEFRCASIHEPNGASLSLLYTANGLTLHGVVDSSGRTITFKYTSNGVASVTQTWMAHSEGLTKTWAVGEEAEVTNANSAKHAHATRSSSLKALPNNAVIVEYTTEMAASDKMLARIFGGPDAVASANGFEPAGLADAYPLYRGDVIGNDGELRRGHLSFAMHLYGGADGKGDSPLYVPAGFTSHSSEPSPTDAVVTFYYPRLGNLTDVTLAVFHIANFQVSSEGERVRIGNIGGPGGSSAFYRHSHIEFYKGNTGLPPLAARPRLRIDPKLVFATTN